MGLMTITRAMGHAAYDAGQIHYPVAEDDRPSKWLIEAMDGRHVAVDASMAYALSPNTPNIPMFSVETPKGVTFSVMPELVRDLRLRLERTLRSGAAIHGSTRAAMRQRIDEWNRYLGDDAVGQLGDLAR